MRIVIAGGSGFIGEKLTAFLVEEGHEVIILTRQDRPSSGNVSYVTWLEVGTSPEEDIEEADAFINLAGVSINDGRWSKSHQQEIYESRMTATGELLRIITALPVKPAVLINASAIGIYPASEHKVYTEESQERAEDFLAKTVIDWEAKANQASAQSIRTVFVRLGVVLGNEGGALPLMVLPYKLFAGGTVGSGEQWVSWIHVRDAIRAIVYLLENEQLSGPINLTAPTPIKMRDFGRTIGAVLQRPHWLPVPSFALKLILGQKSALVLEGQHVVPQKLLAAGFSFQFASLQHALEDILL
ncbi:TIGR01777 family oxidoreductase [Bacillus rubiinfantis]|uniref:TIGR01777 family oxidoreductase n=1 Tax=Bacillus rubiinfantis TaxID=1499680 RepID=UPI0005A6EDC5|nr:TIGR01777 family oxidoreductase [Bacillus rubiinfantis]